MKTEDLIVLVVEKTDTGFSTFSVDYPIFTTASSVVELMKNAYEAVALYFEEAQATISSDNVKFEIDFQQFFVQSFLNARFRIAFAYSLYALCLGHTLLQWIRRWLY